MKKLVSILTPVCAFIMPGAEWLCEDEWKEFGDTRWSQWFRKSIRTNRN
jgi:hypothetical protein